ncbi:LLM class flavin-dependent oxidoreductase [Microbispora sp. ATCC PTA-5024]|uniref:LLM class flavin-dependent oxidoreductase n=1 Tax=Microbispora sp. ATCC PTA-5024 TaxID=316330 RepID=UPI0003DBBBA2|nr:LLM class flavin-dependent oxidoreductase [Microbispora sp. ATCC PTA-5024]ETK37635.1 FAD-linked oxidase [Microbispora sp. ATCC PTA-5024]
MADYGHEPAFGTFITPRNDRPEDVVALARLSERAGLDLVTFQDHPYQAAFLDTWTLLTWVAAQTERVRVSANVINLPLRPPAVLARSAASLDLLSGGRFELGLGAGAFWDAIEAMGGPRRTPGEAIDALSEAIDVIRAVWDPSERGGVRVDGEHYRVRGAKRGPAPAHDISIWLGALKPRMLRLVGAKADGWLPSLPYMKDGDLERGNTIIDEAAAEAGRDPREIRRLLNVGGTFAPTGRGFLQGPPEQWVDDLLPLVLEQGVSTFILFGDEPRAIEVWGGEVAPALREAVARERGASGTAAGEVVRPKARALRRDGIDYDGLPAALRGKAVEPGDRRYASVRSTYMRSGSPGLVIQPESVEDVVAALGFARAQDVPLAIRSGGHGISGRSTNDGGVVVDLGRLNGIEVLDPAGGRIRLGPGARWGHVAEALHPYGLAMSSGDFGDVGVGGLATAGGIGFLARRHGLTIDHVVAADLVLADGAVVRADPETHPDLLWAVRGAGGNVGVVTAIELEAYPLRDVVYARMVFDAAATAPLLEQWGRLQEEAPRELTGFLYLSAQRGASPIAQLVSVYAGDDTQAATDVLTPLLGLGPLLDQQAAVVPYAAIVPASDTPHNGGVDRPLLGSGLAGHLTPEIAGRIEAGLRDRDIHWVAIRSVGGAVNDVDPLATAYAHRHQNFSLSSVGGRQAAFLRHWDALRPHLDGLYLNFETDTRPERLHDAFPGETLTRLRRIKARYDPGNVFDQNFPIPPAAG